jgi:hypothetical protein
MSEQAMRRLQDPGAYCPSCERFIGPLDVCPYCDCDSARNPVFRVLRYGAVLLALSGVALLHLMATHGEVPLVRIVEIGPMMNFGLVRINGEVEKDAFIGKSNGRIESLSFLVDDGSGCLRVVAYGQIARQLVEESLVPQRRSSVDVTGNVTVSADGNTKLILRNASGLKLGSASADGAAGMLPAMPVRMSMCSGKTGITR